MKRIVLLLTIILGTVYSSLAQGYKIEVNIAGVRDSMLLLAMHYGDNKYVRDTAFLNSKGKAVFSKKTPLDEGIYIVALNGTQLFDFIISDKQNQKFSMSAIKDSYVNSLHFTNSPENEEFANFNRYMAQQQKREEFLRDMLSKNNNDEVKDNVQIEEKKIRKEYHDYVQKIEKEYPNTLLLSLVKALEKPQMPDFNIDKNNPKRDSIFTMQYYLFSKNHFFDNINLTDKRLLNTPVFIPSLDYYFDNIVLQMADSIIPVVDTLLSRSSANPDMQRYIAGHLFNKYLESDIMGMESVVVHFIDNYYMTGIIDGQDSIRLADMKQFADRNRSTLIGKQAADLKMESINGQSESVYSLNAPYKLVYFYEPSCGTCKKETPRMRAVYEKYKDKGFKVFAVYTQQNKEEWQQYVVKNNLDWINVWDPRNNNNFRYKYGLYSVPQSFLLDQNNKIIARRINAEGLDKLLDNVLNKNKD